MNKILLTSIAAIALFACATASAQTIRMKAVVPFRFVAGKATLPAGDYTIQSLDDAGTALVIRDSASTVRALLISNACESRDASPSTRLIFHRYGDNYFLTQIWVQGKNAGHEFPAGRSEKEVARNSSLHEVVLAAGR